MEKLLNIVEALSADKNELAEEVQRLRKQLEQNKKDKTTANSQLSQPLRYADHAFSVLGLVLIGAACSKVHHAFVQPMPSIAILFAFSLIGIESLFGVWLVIGNKMLWMWRSTIGVFTVFAGVSAVKALGDATSCGCFGAIDVSPWFTLAFDLSVLAVLLTVPRRPNTIRTSLLKKHELVVGGIVATSLIAVAMWGQSRFVRADGGDDLGKLVVLAPESWPGKPFQLINEVKMEGDLSQGYWEILLFRHDCDVCHDVMRQIERTSQEIDLAKIVLVAIDGSERDGLLDRLAARGCKVGLLSQNREWFATTPLRISVRDGTCLEARVIEHWDR